MEKEQLLAQLDVLKDGSQWSYDQATQKHQAVVGAFTMTVERRGGDQQSGWTVRHERFGELVEWTPCLTAAYGKRDALDYTRAYVLGKFEPQHLDG